MKGESLPLLRERATGERSLTVALDRADAEGERSS